MRRSIRPTPAVTVMKVRTIGTNRAITIARAPYSSKNAIPWGDFDAYLGHLRHLLADVRPDVPVGTALRSVLLTFNDFGDLETVRHRQRMRVILETAALQAHSMTMYAGWRAVIAEYVARRLGASARELAPQTTAWTMLGVALSAYEHWLADESVSLAEALGKAYDTVGTGLSHL